MSLFLLPVRVETGSSNEEGQLVLADGCLVADFRLWEHHHG
jgi:hypothetical protein